MSGVKMDAKTLQQQALACYPNVEKAANILERVPYGNLSVREKLYLGGTYLQLGLFEKGFKFYHYRIYCHPEYKKLRTEFDITKYFKCSHLDQHNIFGKHLCVVLEQGYGDCFMWIRYLLYFTKMKISLVVPSSFHKRLIPSLDYTLKLCSMHNQLTVTDSIPAKYDYWCYLCDLSTIFGIPQQSGFHYMKPHSKYDAKWKSIIHQLKRTGHVNHGEGQVGNSSENKENRDDESRHKIIGINLDGMDKESDYRRVKVDTILPILNLPGYKFINLNIDRKIDHANVLKFPEAFDKDFPYCDTAAIIKHCDTVISVDTSIIHLAGAIGTPSILLLVHGKRAEWRWGLETNKSVWYSNVSIIRKPEFMNRRGKRFFVERICKTLCGNTHLLLDAHNYTTNNLVSYRDYSDLLNMKKKEATERIAMLTLVVGREYHWCVEKAIESKRQYCKKHNYDFILSGLDVYDETRPIAWSKIKMIQKHLSKYDYVFCSDADVVIMNDSITLESFIGEMSPSTNILLTRDWQNLNTGNWFLRNHPNVFSILEQVYAQKQCIHHRWWEQQGFIELYDSTPSIREQTKVIEESHLFNAYILEMPYCKLPESNKYRKGDFLIHFAGVDDKLQLKTQIEKALAENENGENNEEIKKE